ncbi:MAG: peptidase M64 N-terminal domain-containing protein [Cyclobacteriaceae bacterium]|nr:peptidase M64 N-terminal domain-containing protein [Cyclobacteriaceae bacterium]
MLQQVLSINIFYPKTLRIDFELGGNADTTIVFLKEMKEEPFWGGPAKNLTDPFSYGNFRYRVYEANSKKLLYEKGFGSLFEEWQATQEAKSLNRTFYQVATMPYPKTKIRFEIDDRSYATGKVCDYIQSGNRSSKLLYPERTNQDM